MRGVVIAPSFDREAEAIGLTIEERFGEKARRNFVADLARICTLLAHVPKIGKIRHGYNTKLVGLVFEQNWIFSISMTRMYTFCISCTRGVIERGSRFKYRISYPRPHLL
jgi:plasmid stabilization system protein ParE